MKNTITFNKTTNHDKDLYISSYDVIYESKFDLGEFKIHNTGFGRYPFVMEYNGCKSSFKELQFRLGFEYPDYECYRFNWCKNEITKMITDLSNLSYWVSK